MADLFEEDVELIEVEDFEHVATEVVDPAIGGLDARRRLENMLDERRLRDELEDFVDY
jgi:hypothetical protein